MTRKSFIKDGQVRWFNVDGGRVIATFLINGFWISNPTETYLLEEGGWREYIAPVPEPYIPTYAELVEEYLRKNGYPTYGAELAIINNYAQDPTTYADAYAAYMQTRVDGKIWAENQPHRDE